MKHVARCPNLDGTRITVFALLRVQSRGSAATACEQMNQCCQHPQPRIYSAARPMVVGLAAAAFAIVPGRGVKTAI